MLCSKVIKNEVIVCIKNQRELSNSMKHRHHSPVTAHWNIHPERESE